MSEKALTGGDGIAV